MQHKSRKQIKKKHRSTKKHYRIQGGSTAPGLSIAPFSPTPSNGVSDVRNNDTATNNVSKTLSGGKRRRSSSKRRRSSSKRSSNKRRRSSSKRRSSKRRSSKRSKKQRGGTGSWINALYDYTAPAGMMGPVPQPSFYPEQNNLIIKAVQTNVTSQANAQYDGRVSK